MMAFTLRAASNVAVLTLPQKSSHARCLRHFCHTAPGSRMVLQFFHLTCMVSINVSVATYCIISKIKRVCQTATCAAPYGTVPYVVWTVLKPARTVNVDRHQWHVSQAWPGHPDRLSRYLTRWLWADTVEEERSMLIETMHVKTQSSSRIQILHARKKFLKKCHARAGPGPKKDTRPAQSRTRNWTGSNSSTWAQSTHEQGILVMSPETHFCLLAINLMYTNGDCKTHVSANVTTHPKQTSIPCTAQENSLTHLRRTTTDDATTQGTQFRQLTPTFRQIT